MSAINDGGPAFPAEYMKHAPGEVGNNIAIMARSSGMTLRDYFAAKAVVGWLASYPADVEAGVVSAGSFGIAKMAYDIADAMLKTREVQP
ncbi:MAG: hypothetical protein EOP39_04235 [Rubrivivax sp.]|nr:MAG: hypothetical protein EOP39_04235 [Rubrivivax sp.]